jgi:hypothetical protein
MKGTESDGKTLRCVIRVSIRFAAASTWNVRFFIEVWRVCLNDIYKKTGCVAIRRINSGVRRFKMLIISEK